MENTLVHVNYYIKMRPIVYGFCMDCYPHDVLILCVNRNIIQLKIDSWTQQCTYRMALVGTALYKTEYSTGHIENGFGWHCSPQD